MVKGGGGVDGEGSGGAQRGVGGEGGVEGAGRWRGYRNY